jgi:hypothetical protein
VRYVIDAVSGSISNSLPAIKDFLRQSDIDIPQPASSTTGDTRTDDEIFQSVWGTGPPAVTPEQARRDKEQWIEDSMESVINITSSSKSRKPPPILVGHNLVWDLVFLQATFYGTLPDTMAGYLGSIKHMSSRIIDTKLLAVEHNPDFMDLSLQQIVCQLPSVAMAADHPFKWESGFGPLNKSAHDAGYDSKHLNLNFQKKKNQYVDSELTNT